MGQADNHKIPLRESNIQPNSLLEQTDPELYGETACSMLLSSFFFFLIFFFIIFLGPAHHRVEEFAKGKALNDFGPLNVGGIKKETTTLTTIITGH